jgi:DNA (cytosine-5)-methyltransferase 1
MNYSKILEELHIKAINKKEYTNKLNTKTLQNIQTIAQKSFNQKGVFTVLVTLAIYKTVHPKQDIRKHQTQIKGGFSGRSMDTKYITPTLKRLGLPSMAESGWLTRSLEQPYPYSLNYKGKISNKDVKKAFLELVHSIEVEEVNPRYILVELFKLIIELQEANKITIAPLANPEKLTINRIIKLLDKQFDYDYKTSYGSKLPVLAFYAIYQLLIDEISRYKKCQLKALGSHTASDRTSKSAGDIELFKGKELFEAIEIKLDKPIDANILRIAKEKIVRFNPQRYYILSNRGRVDEHEVDKIIEEVKKEHGCQIIINGVLDTLKYYMRLIDNLEEFYTLYSSLISNDTELKTVHKKVWNKLTKELNSEL